MLTRFLNKKYLFFTRFFFVFIWRKSVYRYIHIIAGIKDSKKIQILGMESFHIGVVRGRGRRIEFDCTARGGEKMRSLGPLCIHFHMRFFYF